MLYALEVFERAAYILFPDVEQTCRQSGSHGIVQIVQTVERKVFARHFKGCARSVDDEVVESVDICGGLFFHMLAERVFGGFYGNLAKLGLDYGVVLPENKRVLRCLVADDAELGVDIVLHLVVVAVEMVGSDVEHHGDVGFEVVHIFELE